jgi:hypothetical protein
MPGYKITQRRVTTRIPLRREGLTRKPNSRKIRPSLHLTSTRASSNLDRVSVYARVRFLAGELICAVLRLSQQRCNMSAHHKMKKVAKE